MAEHRPTSRAGSLATSLSEKLKIAGAKTGGSDLKVLRGGRGRRGEGMSRIVCSKPRPVAFASFGARRRRRACLLGARSAAVCAPAQRSPAPALAHPPPSTLAHPPAACLPAARPPPPPRQELNVAVLKATTSQFHVVPKEKHVRSEWPHHQPTLDFFCFCASQQPAPCAVLSAAATASLPLAWVGLAGWQAPRHTCPPRSCPCWLTALACAAPAPRPPAALKQGVQSGRTHREVEHVISELHRRLHDATDWLVRFGGEDTRPASQLQPAHAGPSRAAPTA